jgi:putative ABC transport system permease protein
MANIFDDIKYSLRMLRGSRGFAATVVLTLGLGIGANTAIFSVVNGVMLRELPYPEPDRLVNIWTHNRGKTDVVNSEANFLDYRARIHSLETVGAFAYDRYHLGNVEEPYRILVARATEELLPLLGVPPLLGRTFTAGEDTPDAEPVAVLSHRLWQQSFGGRPEILGRSITLEGVPFTVIGVMPPTYSYPYPLGGMEAWVPLKLDPTNPLSRVNYYLRVVGRVREGTSLEDVRSELAAYGEWAVGEFPENYGTLQFGVSAVDLHEDIVGETRTPLFILLGAVAFVLLIACANVANLLLVRAETQNRQIAIRSALGASWERITANLMAQSLVLAFAGAFVGLLLAYVGSRTLLLLAADVLPRVNEVQIDMQVLGFTTVVSLVSGLLAGLLPALRSSRSSIQPILQQSGRSLSTSLAPYRAHRALITAEVALAVVLVTGAGIMIRSFANLQQLDAGFRTDNVLTMRMSLPEVEYQEPDLVKRFYRNVLANVDQLPGVSSAGIVTRLPLADTIGGTSIQIERNVVATIGEAPVAQIQQVSPGYFETLRLTLTQGRLLSKTDVAGQPNVAVVNETFVREYFSADAAIGKRIRMFRPGSPWIEIVGVVGDVRHEGLQTEPSPKLYVPYAQAQEAAYDISSSVVLVVHSETDTVMLTKPIRSVLSELGRSVAVSNIQTLAEVRANAASDREFPTVLLSFFAFVAMFLSAIGIYSTVSYTVTRQTREIGMRMALGANPGDVLRMVVGQAIIPVAIGLAIGLMGALATTDMLQSLLFNVSPTDPITLGGVVAILAAVALFASYLPAFRASRVDPVTVLRSE